MRVLILTDHRTHSDQNSLYVIGQALVNHPRVETVFVASRGQTDNHAFFYGFSKQPLFGIYIDQHFSFDPTGLQFEQADQTVDVTQSDLILLRLPHPIADGFWDHLTSLVPESKMINRPSGMLRAGNKAFLAEIPHLCPPVKICRSLEDIRSFGANFPIVLKPLESHGGKGILRMEGDALWQSTAQMSWQEALPILTEQLEAGGYLGMKFLKNVGQGDKRIVVVKGNIIGASLRLPPTGSWLCNAALGGRSVQSVPDEHERWLVTEVDRYLRPLGVFIYGLDTLVNDDGQRVISEINTLSIGGIKQMSEQSGRDLVGLAVDEILEVVME